MPKITLMGPAAGASIVLGGTEEAWELTTGVSPVRRAFDVPREALPLLIATGGVKVPMTLRIEGDYGTQDFKFIYIVNQIPGPNPNVARIVLADRRVWWSYLLVAKRYNMRRRVGTKRRGEFAEILQQDVVPEIQYANYSLNNGARWTGRELIKDIITSPDGLNVPEKQFKVDADIKDLNEISIDKLELVDSGDRALARALASVPGAQITVDPDGTVRLFSRVSGKETSVTGTGDGKGTMGPEIVGGGHVEFVSNELEMPSEVEVYYQIESELRFDFVKDGGVGVTVTEGDVPLHMDNVAPIPDFQLEVAGRIEYFGTYVSIASLLTAWTDRLPPDALITQITPDLLNKAMIPGTGLWTALDLLGQLDASADTALWSARFAALQQHYRQTFRLSKEWRDRILYLRDYLVATIDLVSGQRAPARAFADHAYLPSRKALIRSSRGRQDLYHFVNVDGYPGDKVELGDTQPSPARVQILDPEQGIVRLDYLTDVYGFESSVLPSKVKGGNAASVADLRRSRAANPPAINAVSWNGQTVPQLDVDQKVAVLLTASPASPNSKGQFYKITVTAKQVAEMDGIPAAMKAGLAKANGPVKQVFVGPGIETARIRWQEAARQIISRIFGVGGTLDDAIVQQASDGSIEQTSKSARELLKPHCINDDDQENISADLNAASLPAIARAVAASIYSGYHARVKGNITGAMRGEQKISGAIQSIRYYIDGSGATLIQASLPDDVQALDFLSLLPTSTRNIVMKLPAGGA